MQYFFIILLFPILVSAQSEYIDRSDFAVKADYIFTVNDDLSGRGGDLGISILGPVDVGFKYIKTSYEPSTLLESTGTLLYAAYNFRTGRSSLKVLAGYTSISMKIKNLSKELFDISGPFLGIIISPKIYENESLLIMPSFNFSISFLAVENELSASSSSLRDDIIDAGAELNIVPKVSERFYFMLAPSISKSLSEPEAPIIAGFRISAIFNLPQ